MAVTIEAYTDADLRAFAEAEEAAFHQRPDEHDTEDFARIAEPDRLIVARDGGRIVGTAAAFSFQLTVPGAIVPAAGVTAVGVLPSHRRQGVLRGMMRRQLDDVRARGEPMAILWASEGAIYPHFGYGLASLAASFEIERAWAQYRDSRPPAGRVRLIEADEAGALLPAVYERIRPTVPGFVDRSTGMWRAYILADRPSRRHGYGPKFIAVYEVDGTVEGYATYRVKEDWDDSGPKAVLRAGDVHGATEDAVAAIWRFLFDVDLVRTIRASLQDADTPLLLLLRDPRRLGLRLGDGLWLRLVDLPAALAARDYAAIGELVIEVHDEFCPWNEGRWRLEVGERPEAAARRASSVARTSDPPDLSLDVIDLASAYLGGFTFAALARAGRLEASTADAVARADALLASPRRPWCPDEF